MIIELNTKLLEYPEKLNSNQVIFLSMVLDKNQKSNQDVRNIVSLISDDEISYLLQLNLITSIERGNSITYNPTNKLIEYLAPPKSLFDLFYDTYPSYVVRPDGSKCYLRTNVNKCRNLYNTMVGRSEALAEHILKCLNFEIQKKTREGAIGYMKTMWRWLQDHQWEASEEEMKDATTQIKNSYGTELI